MKKQSGITLISLIIYIIVLTAVIGTIAGLQKYYYRNDKETIISTQASEQHSRFLTYITDDINSEKISKDNISVKLTDIQFVMIDWSVHEYKVQDNTLYYIVIDSNGNIQKKIVICKDVESCNFSYNNGVLTSILNINGKLYTNLFNI